MKPSRIATASAAVLLAAGFAVFIYGRHASPSDLDAAVAAGQVVGGVGAVLAALAAFYAASSSADVARRTEEALQTAQRAESLRYPLEAEWTVNLTPIEGENASTLAVEVYCEPNRPLLDGLEFWFHDARNGVQAVDEPAQVASIGGPEDQTCMVSLLRIPTLPEMNASVTLCVVASSTDRVQWVAPGRLLIRKTVEEEWPVLGRGDRLLYFNEWQPWPHYRDRLERRGGTKVVRIPVSLG